jgi:hypothetical protein
VALVVGLDPVVVDLLADAEVVAVLGTYVLVVVELEVVIGVFVVVVDEPDDGLVVVVGVVVLGIVIGLVTGVAGKTTDISWLLVFVVVGALAALFVAGLGLVLDPVMLFMFLIISFRLSLLILNALAVAGWAVVKTDDSIIKPPITAAVRFNDCIERPVRLIELLCFKRKDALIISNVSENK